MEDVISSNDLWWNGGNGFSTRDGKAVFQDPSLVEQGTAALIADADELLRRLDCLGYQLIWTLLGEKIAGAGPGAGRTFSQVARLHRRGRLETSELTFFDDYDESVGPAQATQRRA